VTSRHKIPLAAKVAGTMFLGVLVPVHLPSNGPTHFFWFCDTALIPIPISQKSLGNRAFEVT
jgi:hypothetical protein